MRMVFIILIIILAFKINAATSEVDPGGLKIKIYKDAVSQNSHFRLQSTSSELNRTVQFN